MLYVYLQVITSRVPGHSTVSQSDVPSTRGRVVYSSQAMDTKIISTSLLVHELTGTNNSGPSVASPLRVHVVVYTG